MPYPDEEETRRYVADVARALASIGDRDPALLERYRCRLQELAADQAIPEDLLHEIETALLSKGFLKSA